jgi:alpha-L-arabinofuranosidase
MNNRSTRLPGPRSLAAPSGFRSAGFLLLFFLPGSATGGEPAARAQPVVANVDAGKTHAPISPYVYGQFIEHIGGIINHGLWAEMLDDRKFYHPVLAQEPEPDRAAGGRAPQRRWTVIGPADSVIMDSDRPYAGDRAPLVTLNGPEARGVRQAGLAVVGGKSYSGRAVLAGDTEAVTVSLSWGPSASDRQTVTVGPLAAAYATFPLSFTARQDSSNASLEITGTGRGSFHVGAVSLMPADNVLGFRAEVVAALKSLRSGVYRFPGGNFVSAHEWRDAIGDPDRRAPTPDPVWKAVQPNDVGTDEFLALCRRLDVEPYITVNAGFGDAWSAAQYVEYVNGAATTPMGRLRAANGHPEPYGVRYWGIGNEPWGGWQFGAIPLEQFVVKHNLFAKAMRRVDPTIRLIAGGAMPDAMTGSKQSLRLGGKLIPDFLSPADWTGGLLVNCLQNMDLISEHFYSYNNERFDLGKADGVPVDPDEPLVDWMRRPANHVRAKVEAYEEYLERIPALRERRVPIALDEWAYGRLPRDSYKVVPAYAWVFHEMFRHSDLYQMANFTFATSLLSATRTDAVLNPAGLLFKLYRDRFGAIPVAVSGHSAPPAPRYPAGGDQPRVNAGSDTFPLDVAAAWTGDHQALTVAVINPTESEQQLDLRVRGAELAGKGTLWRMAPSSLDATIVVGERPGVQVEERALDAVPATPTFAPFSVTIYRFPVR